MDSLSADSFRCLVSFAGSSSLKSKNGPEEKKEESEEKKEKAEMEEEEAEDEAEGEDEEQGEAKVSKSVMAPFLSSFLISGYDFFFPNDFV